MIKVVKNEKSFVYYIIIAISSFLIDILFFNIFLFVCGNIIYKIIISTILARIISSFINYLLNKNLVFKDKKNICNTIYKYYLLVVIQMFISAFLVDNIYNRLLFNENLIKIPVDLIIFICNYFIQKIFIFKNNERN